MSVAAPAAVMPSASSFAARSSALVCVRDTSPTTSPSRPKRRATAVPRFGPARTMTIDSGRRHQLDGPTFQTRIGCEDCAAGR